MWWEFEGEDLADWLALAITDSSSTCRRRDDVVIARTGEQFGVSSSMRIDAFAEAADAQTRLHANDTGKEWPGPGGSSVRSEWEGCYGAVSSAVLGNLGS
jgi:hypothetical protein